MSIDDDAFSEALRALSHVDRRRFVRACLRKPCSAGELAAMSSLASASVSEHLKVLRKAVLLELDVRGRYWLYRTNSTVLRRVISRLESLASSS